MLQEIEALMQADQWSEALAACKVLAVSQPANSKVHAYLGICHYHFGDFRSAAEELSRAWALDPHFWQAGKKLIRCYDQLGKVHEALNTAYEVQRVRPSDPDLTHDVAKFEKLIREFQGGRGAEQGHLPRSNQPHPK